MACLRLAPRRQHTEFASLKYPTQAQALLGLSLRLVRSSTIGRRFALFLSIFAIMMSN